MLLTAIHLGEPLVHLGVLLQERLLELLARDIEGITRFPVSLAVAKYLIHVRQELFVACVLSSIHLCLHRAEVHGFGDLLEVVGDVIDDWINWILEGTNKTCPKP